MGKARTRKRVKKEVWFKLPDTDEDGNPLKDEDDYKIVEVSNKNRARCINGAIYPADNEIVEHIRENLDKDHPFNNPPMEYFKPELKEVWYTVDELHAGDPEDRPPFKGRLSKVFKEDDCFRISNKGGFVWDSCNAIMPTDEDLLEAVAFIKEWLGSEHPFSAREQWCYLGNRRFKADRRKLNFKGEKNFFGRQINWF